MILEIQRSGISDSAVLEAMKIVPVHKFEEGMSEDERCFSAVSVVQLAEMLISLDLKADEKVLHLKTCTGYEAALLSKLARAVVTVGLSPRFAERVKKIYSELSYESITVILSDPSIGWEKEAPYDKILITCSLDEVPSSLFDQLKEGGRLVGLKRSDEHGVELSIIVFDKKNGRVEEITGRDAGDSGEK